MELHTMTNITQDNLYRKMRFLANLNKSSQGHFAVLKQADEDGQLQTVARHPSSAVQCSNPGA